MKRALHALSLVVGVAVGLAAGLAIDRGASPGGPAGDEIRLTILQLNDVYEIQPVAGGRAGGLARVATLRRRLAAENPNTIALLAGDFFSPSALGTARVDGMRIDGRQMVDSLGAMGLDLATFGNHEFDVGQQTFDHLLERSRFEWVSSNVDAPDGSALPGVARHRVFEFVAADGRTVRVGVVAVTLDSNRPGYVAFRDPIESARQELAAMGDLDARLALTHLSLDGDSRLAGALPELDLILGGHEHENFLVRRGGDLTPIAKADANARTVYVHELVIGGRGVAVESRLVEVTDAIPDDPATAAVVDGWVERGYAGFRADGFEPDRVIARLTGDLDGREASVRNGSTELTRILGAALRREAPQAEAAIYNSGSIRIDDVLPPGAMTEYDVIRVLPFGGPLVTVRLTGAVLVKALDVGRSSRGTGAFLQLDGIAGGPPAGGWTLGGQAIEAGRTYTVVLPAFLSSGREQGMDFLDVGREGVELVETLRDIRFPVVEELRERYPPGG